jgi:hypothetical protein
MSEATRRFDVVFVETIWHARTRANPHAGMRESVNARMPALDDGHRELKRLVSELRMV